MRDVKKLQRTVLKYHLEHGRHTLPWRKTHDPYAILVSEIMLQQTQVDRVLPYFNRWMKKFPTPKVLARATLIDVLREWSGLGYNRRAKFLHDAAKEIVTEHGGKVPEDLAALLALPGVGDYTAKAVRVFAFNKPETLIETNVRSVFLHHLYPRSKNVADAKLLPLIKKSVELCKSDLHKKVTKDGNVKPRDWYAALMDYGTHLKTLHPNPSRRSKHHTKQSKFEGSMRHVRGAILQSQLRGDSLRTLKLHYPALFNRALRSLQTEGLL